MMTLDQFQAYLYKAQDKAFEERRDKPDKVYDKITKLEDSSKPDYRDVTGIKLGAAGATAYGGVSYTDEYAAGTELVIKYKKYTIMVVTPEELETDMYNGGRVDKDKVKFFANMSKDFAEAGTKTMEIVTTGFQLLGTSTTPTYSWQGAGRDGLALFSTSHITPAGTPVTWSNLQTSAPMSALTLMDGVTMLENIPDDRGFPQGAIKRIGIEYGRYWEWRVPELLKAVMAPDTLFLNNPNALLKRDIEWVPQLNPWLGSSCTSWILKDLDNHGSLRFEKQNPTMQRDIEPWTRNRLNGMTMRYAIGHNSSKGQLLNQGV